MVILTSTRSHSSKAQSNKVQEVFSIPPCVFMGFLAKADGRVSENEIRRACQAIQQMSLSDAMKPRSHSIIY